MWVLFPLLSSGLVCVGHLAKRRQHQDWLVDNSRTIGHQLGRRPNTSRMPRAAYRPRNTRGSGLPLPVGILLHAFPLTACNRCVLQNVMVCRHDDVRRPVLLDLIHHQLKVSS